MFQPAIKWSGSKRSQAQEIVRLFPKEINTYYEPFCGGCSVLRELLDSDIQVARYVCSDLNQDLINLWIMVKEKPEYLSQYYEKLWLELNQNENKDRKRRYFEFIRDRYNRERKAEDFLFIMRTTTNGMPRYNKAGQFNNSFHLSRNGIHPDKLYNILADWSQALNNHNVLFQCCDFHEVSSD